MKKESDTMTVELVALRDECAKLRELLREAIPHMSAENAILEGKHESFERYDELMERIGEAVGDAELK